MLTTYRLNIVGLTMLDNVPLHERFDPVYNTDGGDDDLCRIDTQDSILNDE